MAWWRGDASLFSRSPIHRYAQRILRDNEAALRTRCFSRTPSNSAQHEEYGIRKRPDNMSDFEWIQIQHYERWRKRLEEDPYKTLFGASNNMLSGKGLLDWEWIYKTFPKWMLNDMKMGDEPQGKAQKEAGYPKQVKIRHGDLEKTSEACEPLNTQPSFRRRVFERDASVGIVSPSDPRRPQERSHVKVVGSMPNTTVSNGVPTTESEPLSMNNTSSPVAPSSPEFSPLQEKSSATSETFAASLRDSYKKASDSEDVWALQLAAMESYSAELRRLHPVPRNDKDAAREVPSLDSNETRNGNSRYIIPEDGNTDWMQQAFERRAASNLLDKPEFQTSMLSTSTHEKAISKPAPPMLSSKTLDESTGTPHYEVEQEPETPSIHREEAATPDRTPRPRSTSDLLKQLPQDDIDFLTASDIRASMGTKRSRKPTEEQKQTERQSLQDLFAATPEIPSIDSMLEAQIINNQQVRRKVRKMDTTQNIGAFQATDSPKEQTSTSTADAPVESGINRMRTWLETTGASFAKQFWQDPSEDARVTQTKLFFDKVANHLQKGQAATRDIKDDLEKDIPASIPLLRRLKQDEKLLDSAVHRLRQRSPSASAQGLSPGKTKAMESLKTRFHQTNNELEKAYDALRILASTEAATNATAPFKRRLTAASKVLHKNTQLLRMLILSLQTRLEDPETDRDILSNYKIVVDNLLSLRDTQMTLIRLVERAMLVYGAVPKATENFDAIKTDQSAELDTCEDPFVRARLAADAHLIDEIKAHQSAKEVVRNDKVATEPKPVTNTIFEEPSALAHSLFRPFGTAIEKLGSKEVQDQIKEDARRKLSDATLLQKIKHAYEDTCEEIFATHEQAREMAEHDVSKPIQKEGPEVVAVESKDTAPLTLSKPLANSDCVPISPGDVEGVETHIPALKHTVTALKNDQTIPTTTPSELATTTNPDLPTTPAPLLENLPTHYTIVIHDPQTDALSITTSTTAPPRDTSPAMPLHQALSALNSPAKFIPYITVGLEVVSAKHDILILRNAIDSTSSTRPFETIRTASPISNERSDYNRNIVNPIDGTVRLSPTGYVGPDESAEQLEKEFQHRREAAGKVTGKESKQKKQPGERYKNEKKKGAGGVVKTAIWVAGMCYVAGVIGEIATGA